VSNQLPLGSIRMSSFDINRPLKDLPMKQFLLPSMAGKAQLRSTYH
jgi:hypothetical protein